MATLSSSTRALLRTIAELRSSGKTWENVAARMGVPVSEVEALVSAHSLEFEEIQKQAEENFHHETRAEMIATLRQLLKSSKEGEPMRAALALVRLELARTRETMQIRSFQLHSMMERSRRQRAARTEQADAELESPENTPIDEPAEQKTGGVTIGATNSPENVKSAVTNAPAAVTSPAAAKPVNVPEPGKRVYTMGSLARAATARTMIEGLATSWLAKSPQVSTKRQDEQDRQTGSLGV